MKRYAMTVMLKDDPEIIRRYEAYHANPWQETNEGLLRVGVHRMYIYRYLRTLFMFMETRPTTSTWTSTCRGTWTTRGPGNGTS